MKFLAMGVLILFLNHEGFLLRQKFIKFLRQSLIYWRLNRLQSTNEWENRIIEGEKMHTFVKVLKLFFISKINAKMWRNI